MELGIDIHKSKDSRGIAAAIEALNRCHDACLTRICFVKRRELDENNGSLIYPFEDVREFVNCDIEMELLINSFQGAKKDQKVRFQFENADRFSFSQSTDFDYADIYDLEFRVKNNAQLEFTFFSTGARIEAISVTCEMFTCEVL